MAVVPLPPYDRIRRIAWSLDRPSQVNVSGYTGRRAIVANPWHGRWSAQVEVAPLVGESNVRHWRAFLASLKGRINTFYLPATETPQHAYTLSNASLVNRANTTVTHLGGAVYRVTKTGGADGSWIDADAISGGAFYGDFTIRMQPRQTNKGFMVGVNADPNSDSSYTSLDRAIYFDNAGTVTFFEGSFQMSGLAIPYTASQYWFLRRTGSTVSALYGSSTDIASATLVYTFSGLNAAVYVDSSFLHSGAAVDVFASYPQPVMVASGGSAGSTLMVLLNAPSFLSAGMMLTVTLASGNRQLVMLTAGSRGQEISFEPPLRETAPVGNIVETAAPYAQVGLANSAVGWSADAGQLYGISFAVEEVF